MAFLFIKDYLDYDTVFFPTHVICKDGISAVRVSVGSLPPEYIEDSDNTSPAVGLFIADIDVERIDLTKKIILIHDPDFGDSSIPVIIKNLLAECPTALDSLPESQHNCIEKAHVHLWFQVSYEPTSKTTFAINTGKI
jgi:hypothetical protein